MGKIAQATFKGGEIAMSEIKHKRKNKTFLQDADLEFKLMRAVLIANEANKTSERISMSDIINRAIRNELKAMKIS